MNYKSTDSMNHYFSFGGTVFIVPIENVRKINSFSGKDVIARYVKITGGLSDVYANSTYGKMIKDAVNEKFNTGESK